MMRASAKFIPARCAGLIGFLACTTALLLGQARSVPADADLSLGLVQTLSIQKDPNKTDTRVSRLLALYCPGDQPVTPFLSTGPFVSTWEGFIRADINDDYTFTVVSNGRATVAVNGETVLKTNDRGRTTHSQAVEIRNGLNPVSVIYRSPRQGSAEFRLNWESATIEREAIPATHLVRHADPADLKRGLALRRGRKLFAQHRCLQCHARDTEIEALAMPELAFAAPKLDHIGIKFRSNWVARYLDTPQEVAPHSVMPSVLTSQAEAADIAAYLAGLSPRGTSEPRLALEAEKVVRGESLHRDLGCLSCHRFSSEEPYGPEDHRIAYEGLAGKWKLSSLTAYLQDPQRDYPGSPMPNFQLTNSEASVIAHYLLSNSGASGSTLGPAARGNAQRGEELVVSRGCLNCHALAGHASTLVAGSLSSIIISGFDSGCLAGPEGNPMGSPFFPFTPEDRDALCLFLKESVDSISRYIPFEFADRHMQVKAFIAGKIPYKARPKLLARMPAFPAYAEGIVEGLAQQHGFPPSQFEK